VAKVQTQNIPYGLARIGRLVRNLAAGLRKLKES
jgi:hypothetical protein